MIILLFQALFSWPAFSIINIKIRFRTGSLRSLFVQRIHLEFIVTLIMASLSGPDAAKQARTMVLPPPCFTNEIRFFSKQTKLILTS